MKPIKKPAEYTFWLNKDEWLPIIERAIRLDNPNLPTGGPSGFTYSAIVNDQVVITFKEEE